MKIIIKYNISNNNWYGQINDNWIILIEMDECIWYDWLYFDFNDYNFIKDDKK